MTRCFLYNPTLWRGVRAEALSNFDAESGYCTAREADALWRYMLEHESVAHALNIYLDLGARYPHTRAAPDALYTAAVCQQHLSNFNAYWRAAYKNGLHAGSRMVTYADVRRAYPNYQLPRATNGWQARNANGQRQTCVDAETKAEAAPRLACSSMDSRAKGLAHRARGRPCAARRMA